MSIPVTSLFTLLSILTSGIANASIIDIEIELDLADLVVDFQSSGVTSAHIQTNIPTIAVGSDNELRVHVVFAKNQRLKMTGGFLDAVSFSLAQLGSGPFSSFAYGARTKLQDLHGDFKLPSKYDHRVSVAANSLGSSTTEWIGGLPNVPTLDLTDDDFSFSGFTASFIIGPATLTNDPVQLELNSVDFSIVSGSFEIKGPGKGSKH